MAHTCIHGSALVVREMASNFSRRRLMFTPTVGSKSGYLPSQKSADRSVRARVSAVVPPPLGCRGPRQCKCELMYWTSRVPLRVEKQYGKAENTLKVSNLIKLEPTWQSHFGSYVHNTFLALHKLRAKNKVWSAEPQMQSLQCRV